MQPSRMLFFCPLRKKIRMQVALLDVHSSATSENDGAPYFGIPFPKRLISGMPHTYGFESTSCQLESRARRSGFRLTEGRTFKSHFRDRSEEHTSELQSPV